MANVSIISKTETSISVVVEGMSSGYLPNNRVCSWYLDGVYKGKVNLAGGVTSDGLFTFTGLTSCTTYSIMASITASDWGYSVELTASATTEERKIKPWSWTDSNSTASASATLSAYTAVQGKGLITDFSYLVWNDMVDKAKEILDAKGLSWNNRFASYTATKMSYSDRQLTATRFNSLRYNVELHYPTGVSSVSKGDTVYGWYFTALTDSINNWI